MKKVNVLVLGVGGNVSQGILKALNQSDIDFRVVGACVSHESLGLYFCDVAYLSPYAQSEEFIPWLIDVCNKESIDIVFTGVEEILIKIAENIEEFNKGTRAIFKSTSLDKLIIGQDKLKTNIWLRDNGCNYPKFLLSTDINKYESFLNEVGYPLIAKPIKGKGSKGIIRINNDYDLEKMKNYEGYIIQEYIGDDSSEYTVGCYRSKAGVTLDPIIFHRELKYGTTFKAEVVENDIIKLEAIKICSKFQPIGPLNIQLRLDKNNRPVCFELNVRYSGTTPIRAHFGFNDVEAMIREYVFNEDISSQFRIRKGTAYRYFNEIYFDDNVITRLKENRCINDVGKYRVSIDKLGE